MTDQSTVRSIAGRGIVGPASAIAGAILLLAGTWMHPMSADPNVALAAFTEYAASQHWVLSHLMQLFGFIFMVVALVMLSEALTEGGAASFARLGSAFAIVSLAASAALQAVDGVALKSMVNNWAASPGQMKDAMFQAAFGVRQIEVGLASVTSLLFGITATIYATAILIDGRLPKWMGILAIVSGVPTAIAGVAMAYTGFSGTEMAISMPASLLSVFWMLALGAYGFRRALF